MKKKNNEVEHRIRTEVRFGSWDALNYLLHRINKRNEGFSSIINNVCHAYIGCH